MEKLCDFLLRKYEFRIICSLILICLFVSCTGKNESQKATTVLESSNIEDSLFINPPNEFRPKTWMHAMSGNMSKAGLTKDLESMKQVGLGGLLLFNISQGIPNGPIIYDSDEHHEMIKHAAKEAERLGLSFGVHNCDGWSSSGGPWIKPEESMKMLVWTDTIVSGGKHVLRLDQPTTRENYYEDITVFAYPSLSSEIDDIDNSPVVTASDKGLNVHLITDGKWDEESRLNDNPEKTPWLQFSYSKPKTIRSAKLIFTDRHATAMLQTSKDGETFMDVRELFKVRTGKGEWAINDHFEGISSKYFRLKFNQPVNLREVELSANYYINNPLGRTAIARTEDRQMDLIGRPSEDMVIKRESIINLGNGYNKETGINVDLPEGKYTIVRIGQTSTGAFNNPASHEGRGLEVDKLNRTHFKKHYDAFVHKVVENVKEVAPNAMQYAEIDSYEMGGQNWTDDFDQIFDRKMGYDIKDFFPLITGRFVESPEVSESVLGDFRKLISDLMTKNYFEYFTELCHEDGIKSYIEPYGFGPLNDLDVGGVTDIPMGEFWMNRPITQTQSAISSAHIYGKPVISAESFTSGPAINWKGNPAMAKTSGDLAWTYGINEFMFHRFAHQANIHAEPGMTMNRWGFHMDRTQTWWDNAGKAWFDYVARGSYLLRQGVNVADLLIYVGEAAPNSAYERKDFDPEIPKSINFDNVNTDVLLNRIQINDGRMDLPEGSTYRALILKNVEKISLKTLIRLKELSDAGIPLYGDQPKKLSGYQSSVENSEKFIEILKDLESKILPIESWGVLMESISLNYDLIPKDQEPIDYIHRKTANDDIYFFYNADTTNIKTFDLDFRIKNKIPELWNPMNGKIVKHGVFTSDSNLTNAKIRLQPQESVFVVFREKTSNSKSVVIPVEDADFFLSNTNDVEAKFYKNGDYIISFDNGNTANIEIGDIPQTKGLSGPWTVDFNEKSGYGGQETFTDLIDWSRHSKDSINYYSGTAAYSTEFYLSSDHVKEGMNAMLDLGQVFIVAEVEVNGEHAGISWIAPYELDITSHIKAGKNIVKIHLTNQWSNRLIGDERYPANDGNYELGPHRATDLTMPEWYIKNEPRPNGKRTTFTTAPFYKKDDPLMPSGLIGPVQIKFSKTLKLE